MSVPENLQWGYKFVGTDLSTDDHQGGRFRYRLGEWHEAENPTEHADPCPRAPGDGLCVARTLSGAQSGGLRLGASVMLLVGFTAADVLADRRDRVRVARLWVHPDPVDPLQAITGHGANLRSANLRSANLRSADLRSANLRSANLSGADLSGAYLRSAYLRSADLSGAYLRSADLSGADLSGAYLRSADLRSANLRSANLSGANLSGANLRSADLRSADLRSANLRSANLRSADLRSAIGNTYTVLPAGWMVSDNGFVVPA